jgi:hypothetical protein
MKIVSLLLKPFSFIYIIFPNFIYTVNKIILISEELFIKIINFNIPANSGYSNTNCTSRHIRAFIFIGNEFRNSMHFQLAIN